MSKKLMRALVAALVYTLTGCGQLTPVAVNGSASKPLSARNTVGAGGYQVKEELLVKFKAQVTTNSVQIFHAQHGTRTLRVIPGLNIHVMTITNGQPVAKVLAQVTTSPMVEYAEPNRSFNLED